MIEAFADSYSVARRRGTAATLSFVIRAFADLLIHLVGERYSQLVGEAPYRPSLRRSQKPRRAGMSFTQRLRQDARFAVRSLRKSPTFTIAAVLTLAIAIGANGAMFSLVRGVLLNPLPYEESHRLVRLVGSVRGEEMNRHSYLNFVDYSQQSETLTDLSFVQHWAATVHFDQPERLRGLSVAAPYFDALRIRPHIGRFFQAADDLPGHEAVAVVSYAFWRDRLDSDENIIGQSLRLGDEHYTPSSGSRRPGSRIRLRVRASIARLQVCSIRRNELASGSTSSADWTGTRRWPKPTPSFRAF